MRAAGFSIGDLHDKPQVRQWDPRQRPPGVIASPAEPRYCLRALECAGLRRCDSFGAARWISLAYVWVGCVKELLHAGSTYLQPAKLGLRGWIIGNQGRACTGLERSWKQGLLMGICSESFSLATKSRLSAFHSGCSFFRLFFLLSSCCCFKKKKSLYVCTSSGVILCPIRLAHLNLFLFFNW